MVHQTHNQQLLTPLRKSIVDKPPYISGTLQLPDSFLSLFYVVSRNGNAARFEDGDPQFLRAKERLLTSFLFRRINFANATPDELEQLTQACEVFDNAYGKVGRMDRESFSSSLDPFRTDLIKIIRGYLLEGEESAKNMEIKPYKLNTYSAHLILSFIRLYLIPYCCPGKGSSFKPHVNTPRNKKMFGSLVIVFPTHHEGGALSLRRRGHEWIFDPVQASAGGASDRPSIGYMAFLNGIEQDVAPVTSGHCVTLTYNLYFVDDGGPVSGKGAVSKLRTPPKPPNQDRFLEAFKALLENQEFMADGGTLAFGLRHGYPIKYDLKPIYAVLKGSDAVVYQCVRALGFEPALHIYYDEEVIQHEGMIIDKVIDFQTVFLDFEEDSGDPIHKFLQEEGGILVHQDGGHDDSYIDHDDLDDPEISELMEWVTPITTYNRKEGVYALFGDKLGTSTIHGDACMIVRIGRVGDRLLYPTVAQKKRTYEQSRYEEHSW